MWLSLIWTKLKSVAASFAGAPSNREPGTPPETVQIKPVPIQLMHFNTSRRSISLFIAISFLHSPYSGAPRKIPGIYFRYQGNKPTPKAVERAQESLQNERSWSEC